MDNLDELFSNGETISADVTAEPEVAAEPETGPVRDDKGRFAPKQTGVEPEPETVTEAVTPAADKLPPETFKGLQDERRKRQEAEQRIAALEQQLQSLQTPAEPPAPPPSIWEDEQGFGQHLVGQATSQASFNAKLDMSEMLASQAHEDFDEMKARFIEMMDANPSLQQQALSARHPWEKAYQIAKNAAKMEALGAVDVTDLEAKLREQIKAELEAQQPAAPAVLPVSLADNQSSRGVAAGWQPTPFEELFGPKR